MQYAGYVLKKKLDIEKYAQSECAEAIPGREFPGIPETRPMIIAHRGACGYLPEHTLESYNLAFELGADAIEPDVVATADGVLLIRHENELSGTTNIENYPEFADRRATKIVDGETITGWFAEDFTWEELQRVRARERIPQVRGCSAKYDDRFELLRLADLLMLVDDWQTRVSRTLRVVIELKHVRYLTELGFDIPQLIAQEFQLAGWGATDHPRIVFESFELSALNAIAHAGLPGKRIFLIYNEDYPADAGWAGIPAKKSIWFMSKRGMELAAEVADGISVPKSFIAKRLGRYGRPQYSTIVSDAAKLGLEVYIWTLRAENEFLMPVFQRGRAGEWGNWYAEFRFLIDSGVTAIFVDQPDLAIAAKYSVKTQP